MNKFIEFTAVGLKRADIAMGIEPEEAEVRLSVKPAEIIAITEVPEDPEGCLIYLKSGENWFVRMKYDKVIELLNTW